jgi:5'-3' exoribonuclease 1
MHFAVLLNLVNQPLIYFWSGQFFPSEKAEIERFTKVVSSRSPGEYFRSYDVANMVGISGMALSRIASSFMVLDSNGTKINLGLSLKFEAKGLKVMDYSRKIERVWEFSRRAVELLREYKVREATSTDVRFLSLSLF